MAVMKDRSDPDISLRSKLDILAPKAEIEISVHFQALNSSRSVLSMLQAQKKVILQNTDTSKI